MKYVLTALLLAIGVTAHAESDYAASVEYSGFNAKVENVDTIKLSGVALTYAPAPTLNGLNGKFEYLQANKPDVSYIELSGNYQFNLLRKDNFYALASIGIGLAQADADLLKDKINYFTLPLGVELGYSFLPQVSGFAGIGYKWAIDFNQGSEGGTVCKDGWHSPSIGSQGACSWHGGVAYYQGAEQTYSADGLTYKIGLRYRF